MFNIVTDFYTGFIYKPELRLINTTFKLLIASFLYTMEGVWKKFNYSWNNGDI